MPSPNVGDPLSVLLALNLDYGVSVLDGFEGPPIGCEGSLSRFKISRQLPTMHKFWSATRIMLESHFTKYS